MGALEESGDLIDPIANGVLKKSAIVTLAQLCSGEIPGRGGDGEITLFKAVGTALADIASGALVYETILREGA